MSEDPLRAVADRLYALAPGEFTPVRDAEAKAARDDGDRDLAERVKRLRKPSSAAWVVNMLMRHRQEHMVQVLDLGESLRRAQADLDADGLRELTRQRRRLIAAVAGDGRALARELGQKVSESVARQVEDTLHAAMIDTDAAAAVRTGMLLDALTPAGVGSLKEASAIGEHTALGSIGASAAAGTASGSASRGQAGLSVVPQQPEGRGSGAARRGTRRPAATGVRSGTATGAEDQREREEREAREAEQRAAEERRRAVAEADRAVAEAEDAADDAQERRRKADKRVAKLEARGLQLQSEAEELRRRLAEVEHEAEALDEETAEAEDRRDAARQRLEQTEARLDAARQRRAELDG